MESRRPRPLPSTTRPKPTWADRAAITEDLPPAQTTTDGEEATKTPRRRRTVPAFIIVLLLLSAVTVFSLRSRLWARPTPVAVTSTVANSPQVCAALTSRRADLTNLIEAGALDHSVLSNIPPTALTNTDCAISLQLLDHAIADEYIKETLYNPPDSLGRIISKTPEQIRAIHPRADSTYFSTRPSESKMSAPPPKSTSRLTPKPVYKY